MTKSTTEEIDIQLPYYSKTNVHFFKVIDERSSICIHDGSDSFGIEKRFHTASCFDLDNMPSNKEEFDEAFLRVSEKLSKITYSDLNALCEENSERVMRTM